MADPKSQLVTFPLAVGMDNVSLDEVVQPSGQSPRVRLSRNTRLSKTPGMVSKAPGVQLLASDLGAYCGGVVPIADRESTAVFLGGFNVSRRVAGSQIGQITNVGGSNVQQDGYFPVTVESAGALPGGTANFNVASAYQPSTGYTYFAWIDAHPAGFAYLTISVLDDSGRVVALDTQLQTTFNTNPLSVNNIVGITALGSKVHVWTQSFGVAFLAAIEVVLSADLKISLGTGIGVHTLFSAAAHGNIALAYDPDDTTHVYLACRSTAAANSVEVLRMDVTGIFPIAVAQQTHAIGVAWDYLSIAYKANDAVLLAVSRTSGSSNFYELNRTTLAATWTQTGRLYQGVVGCGFYMYHGPGSGSGASVRVFAASRLPPATPTAGHGTYVEGFTTGGVQVPYVGGFLQNKFLCGQVCTHKVSATEFYALIPCVTLYGSTGSYDPNSLNFVHESSIEIYRTADYYMLSCIARLGVDLVLRYPGQNVTGNWTSGGMNSCLMHGSRMLVTYLGENVEEGVAPDGHRARYAWLELGAKQPLFAHAPGGAALIAGALPAVWDGRETTEHSPRGVPVILVSNTGGSAPWSGAPATYLFAAVVSWRDATGRIHRSAPSNVATLTGTGVQPNISVFVPDAYRRSDAGGYGAAHEWMQVTIYVSEPNGLVLYAQNYRSGAFALGRWQFTTPAQSVASAFNPALYSDGSPTQELAAFSPNASRDVAVVGDRPWMLDAERPNRAWYGKPVVSGYAPEFNPDQYVDFPADAGALQRVVNGNGIPLFLGAGIWTVAGEGPDALLRGTLYAAPTQLSDFRCTQASCVIQTPAGLFFVSENRFCVYTGSVRPFFEIDVDAYGVIVGTAVFRKQHEVCFFTAQGFVYVYNWQADGWTLWDQTVTGVTTLIAVAQVPSTGKVLFVGDTGELRIMDPDTVHATAQISIKTGWIAYGGPHERANFANLLLHARRAAAHGLQIDIDVDYREDLTVSKPYSSAEVLALVRDQVDTLRYDAMPEPSDQAARVVSLTFTETGAAGEAFQPINCTLELIRQSTKDLRGIADAARK